MQNESPDEILMTQAAHNDTAAFDTLFARHQNAAFNFTLRMVGDRTLAEDLTQECFLRVWQARQNYRPTAMFRTWLFTICRRLVMDALKKQSVPITNADDLDYCHASSELAARLTTLNPQTILMTRELERVMERALEALPEELREVVLLRDMEGIGYDQIAAIVGCPLGTVKSRLNAARKRLQAAALAWLKETET